jgi:hypothetical protein
MPKAILEFNLPEEKEEFESAKNGGCYKLALWDLDQYLRGILKYNSDAHDQKTIDELQNTRNKLHEFLHDYDLSL